MNILITESGEISSIAIKLLRKGGHDVFLEHYLADKIDALFIRTYTKVDAQYLSQFPNLKYILRAGVGLDNIDLDECKRKNIQVINAPGSNANAVSDFVVGLIIILLRNIKLHSSNLRQGGWRDKDLLGEELTNKTIGLVGCGAIGKLVVKKLAYFGIKTILGYDPYLDKNTLKDIGMKKCTLDFLLKHSDIVSLHLPLTETTKNLISAKELNLMKKNSYLINTSRGGIVNENDLIKALKRKTIKGAALDVFENEPQLNKELLKLESLILTPHIAGYTQEANVQMSIVPAERFLDMLKTKSN